jgi:phenylalanyl-tRNA synthetase alpha subunit
LQQHLLITVGEQDAILKNAAEGKKKAMARVADLEDKLENAGAVRERELKQAENEVDEAKKQYDLSVKRTKDIEKVDCYFHIMFGILSLGVV